jgi:hypothetical protein
MSKNFSLILLSSLLVATSILHAMAADPTTAPSPGLLEAEDAELLGGATIKADSGASAGFSVGWITRAGDGIRFPTTPAAAWLEVRHCGPGGEFSLYAGDKLLQTIHFPQGDWKGPWIQTAFEVAIPGGTPFMLRLEPQGKGAVNLDCILFSAAKPTLPLTLAPARTGRERTADILIEWGYDPGREKLAYDGRIEVTQNGTVLKVAPLQGSSTTMTGPASWTSAPAGGQRRGIVAAVRYCEDQTGTKRTILTIRTTSGSFSFVPAELDPLPDRKSVV